MAVFFDSKEPTTTQPSSERKKNTLLGVEGEEEAREPESEVLAAEKVGKDKEVCTLCKELVGETVHYFAENQTQTEIIDILHKSCSKLLCFKQKCITLVD
ncbi:unnamed protein product [Ilex paraguariensis]|uniref:Saposin B-type domain-containing protein n=1 Tax=Ilex paraguariensis TaxID=185542 RepID=A0ABC8SF28_9AQUA